MISKYVLENEYYSKGEIENIFDLDSQESYIFFRELQKLKIIKAHTKDDDDIEEDVMPNSFSFEYVGIILCCNRVVKILPKYIKRYGHIPTDDGTIAGEFRVILKAIQTYKKKKVKTYNTLFSDYGNDSNVFLGLILYLLDDFIENGVYKTTNNIVEVRNEGPIEWGMTVDNISPYIYKNRPYYFDVYTNNIVEKQDDYIRKLHEHIIDDCIGQLVDAELTDLFSYPQIDVEAESMDSLGGVEYALKKIQYELNVQFETRKQILLRTIEQYLFIRYNKANLSSLNHTYDQFHLWGVYRFEHLWQTACEEVFNDSLDKSFDELAITPYGDFNGRTKLKEVVEKPSWDIYSKGSYSGPRSTKGYELDFLYIEGNKLYIIDAKYYCMSITDKSVSGQPGMSDITKQYFYQLAYRDFVKKTGIKKIRNAFVLPTEGDIVVNSSTVRYHMFLENGFSKIKVRCIPAKRLLIKYASNQKESIDYLNLEE